MSLTLSRRQDSVWDSSVKLTMRIRFQETGDTLDTHLHSLSSALGFQLLTLICKISLKDLSSWDNLSVKGSRALRLRSFWGS
ncbi:hypothetical protein TNCT_615651 [Trichonephila clavata]|uniref:Uncharacterized protein n=1 Tax=Trichonephila clavata TaxID=2740835 RepID=A0A8X6HXI2_TRICU|nr:hypothetical protein TNCT_615651 [Trichonephila clavata]